VDHDVDGDGDESGFRAHKRRRGEAGPLADHDESDAGTDDDYDEYSESDSGSEYMSAADIAAAAEYRRTLRRSLTACGGRHITASDPFGQTLLHAAVWAGDAALVQHMLARPGCAALVDARTSRGGRHLFTLADFAEAHEPGDTPLGLDSLFLSSPGTFEAVTPLGLAVATNRPDIAALLLEAGADPLRADALGLALRLAGDRPVTPARRETIALLRAATDAAKAARAAALAGAAGGPSKGSASATEASSEPP